MTFPCSTLSSSSSLSVVTVSTSSDDLTNNKPIRSDDDDTASSLTHRLDTADLLMPVLEHYLLNTLLSPSTSTSTSNANTNSIFHAIQPPHISPLDYFRRLVKYAYCSRAAFVAGLYYVGALARRGVVSVCALSVHRLLVTGVLVATKGLDDVLYDNAHFAKVGGLDVAELNRLELDMLKALDFKLVVCREEFQRFEGVVVDGAAREGGLGRALRAGGFWEGGEEEGERSRSRKKIGGGRGRGNGYVGVGGGWMWNGNEEEEEEEEWKGSAAERRKEKEKEYVPRSPTSCMEVCFEGGTGDGAIQEREDGSGLGGTARHGM